MAYELNLSLGETELDLTAELIVQGASVASVSLTESPAGSGHYCNASDLPSLPDGLYSVRFETADAVLKGSGALAWKDGQEVSPLLLSRSITVGAGAKAVTISVEHQGSPLEDVAVWVSRDAAGTDVVAGTLHTDATGSVTFHLDDGTWYVWQHRSGYTFTNPQTITVS
jgi:hypothetical protein